MEQSGANRPPSTRKKLSELRQRVAADQPIRRDQLPGSAPPIDTTAYDGEKSPRRTITIDGQVKTDAGTSAKKYVFTLQRVTTEERQRPRTSWGGGVITDRKDAQ